MNDLASIAAYLMTPGKGLLAADESAKSADKRMVDHGFKGGPKMRHDFRDMLLLAPGIENYLSGVILYEETLSQKDAKGKLIPALLHKKGIYPGIKVDLGLEPIPESPEEDITGGLIGLSKRLHQYRDTYDTKFTKWRALIKIDGDHIPTAPAIVENVKRLAMSSRCVQEAGMVPIVEPEVLYEGTHSRLRAKEVLTQTLSALVKALEEHSVDPSGTILKTAMVLSGHESGRIDTPEEVAIDTLEVLMNTLPRNLAGVVFLSGGQTPDQATDNLAAIMKLAKEKHAPWPITFSYSRALQDEALNTWKTKKENVPAARKAFIARLEKVAAALG